MKFTKYHKWGDYHWELYKIGTLYTKHADKVKDWIKEKNVLDVGCGDGLITSLLNCKGIDNSEEGVVWARKHGVDAEVGDVYTMYGQYDAVFLGDVLEHLDRPDDALRNIAKMTDVLYLTTPPRGKKLRPLHFQEWTTEELKTYMAGMGWTTDTLEVKNDRIYGRFQKNSL